MFEDNSDFVESINTDDELHRIICRLVWNYGRGSPVGVVWSKNDNTLIRKMTGTVVSQCQNGQAAYKVSVSYDNDFFRVEMLQHQKTVKTDYFAP